MNIRMPISFEDKLKFCNEEWEFSYPQIGQMALRAYQTEEEPELPKREKEKLSNEGYNFGDKPFCYTTEEFRKIIIWYVDRAVSKHKSIPLELDDYVFETDEQQLLIQVTEEKMIKRFVNLLDSCLTDASAKNKIKKELGVL